MYAEAAVAAAYTRHDVFGDGERIQRISASVVFRLFFDVGLTSTGSRHRSRFCFDFPGLLGFHRRVDLAGKRTAEDNDQQ